MIKQSIGLYYSRIYNIYFSKSQIDPKKLWILESIHYSFKLAKTTTKSELLTLGAFTNSIFMKPLPSHIFKTPTIQFQRFTNVSGIYKTKRPTSYPKFNASNRLNHTILESLFEFMKFHFFSMNFEFKYQSKDERTQLSAKSKIQTKSMIFFPLLFIRKD